MWATGPCSALSENVRIAAGSWQGTASYCELTFNTAGERHGMCESALRRKVSSVSRCVKQVISSENYVVSLPAVISPRGGKSDELARSIR
jgi:hypothetical protein